MKKQLDVLAVEIFAIVLSILLAFSIDAWWSEYKDRQKGDEYAARVENELEGMRDLTHIHLRAIDRKIAAGESVEEFFSGANKELSPVMLINSLYNMGRDTFDTFDTTTFDDLISSGQFVLVADPEVRAAIRVAYQRASDTEPELWPYRDEYLKGVRAWIPQDTVDVIRAACPDITVLDDEYRCELADVNDRIASELATRFKGDDAMLAFRLREHGLYASRIALLETLHAIETALGLFRDP
jgi:hypothetical protein